MKLTMKLLALFFGLLMLTTVANAESPREQLQQMVEQLQKSPTGNALREKIIKLAQTIKPAPAVPEEAERFEGRAQFAFKNAKSPADYLDAAKEYEKAIAAAPWVPGYYADLCTIYEKAEKYAEAKKSCEFFLASSPSAQDASDVRKRIAGLEFAIEKANSPEARASKNSAELLQSLNGAVFLMERGCQTYKDSVCSHVEFNGNSFYRWIDWELNSRRPSSDIQGVVTPCPVKIEGNRILSIGNSNRCSVGNVLEWWFELSADGRTLNEYQRSINSTLISSEFRRVN